MLQLHWHDSSCMANFPLSQIWWEPTWKKCIIRLISVRCSTPCICLFKRICWVKSNYGSMKHHWPQKVHKRCCTNNWICKGKPNSQMIYMTLAIFERNTKSSIVYNQNQHNSNYTIISLFQHTYVIFKLMCTIFVRGLLQL